MTQPDIEIRIAGERESAAWVNALRTAFLSPPVAPEDAAAWWRHRADPGRLLGAWEGDRCVGVLRGVPLELTVPGGAALPADGIAHIAVLSTHRRRGILTRMLETGLARARDRGDALAALCSSEHRIYGRFGFGHAARSSGLTIDVPRSGGLRPGIGQTPGRVDLADLADLAEIGPALHDRVRAARHGAVSRPPRHWLYATGEAVDAGHTFTPPFVAVHRDPAGRATGVMTYRTQVRWSGGDPDGTLTVDDVLATGPGAAAALWRHALQADWVRTVTVRNLAPDDPLPLWLRNPRAAEWTGDQAEDMWLRVLDAPRAFAARTYDVPGRTVLDVADPQGHVAGRWLLDTAADGTGALTPTTADPDLALDASALAALYLGGRTVPRLAAAGLVEELRPGAAARAGLQLRTALAPWTPDMI
ncbi:GNAT family N-acetyltransferase [Actinomadura xylanilytica]|uniref:GNAT family N-acetyltransferase n=1 Tax=Actinomadura xylanilytica TaxID=887459 RepID=UPI00255B35D7|nr:GNAT family N-acetyltransferase [Actinomadura xylanilytica]MDL4776910.1 GNAT family N-acetyltransferase [Actinomadura xylanilytica]